MIASKYKMLVHKIIFKYGLCDKYNADKLGLFYQVLTIKTIHMERKKSSVGKHNKVWLNGLAAANALGKKLPMFMISKQRRHNVSINLETYYVAIDLKCRTVLFVKWAKKKKIL